MLFVVLVSDIGPAVAISVLSPDGRSLALSSDFSFPMVSAYVSGPIFTVIGGFQLRKSSMSFFTYSARLAFSSPSVVGGGIPKALGISVDLGTFVTYRCHAPSTSARRLQFTLLVFASFSAANIPSCFFSVAYSLRVRVSSSAFS